MLNINFQQLKTQIKETLDDNGVNYTDEGIDAIVDKWVANKQHLLNLFSQHPNWDNDCLAVVYETDYERELNISKAAAQAEKIFDAYVSHNPLDESNLRTVRRELDFIDYEEWENAICKMPASPEKFRYATDYSGLCGGRTASASNIVLWKRLLPKAKIGTRSSRLWRKVFEEYGIDKYPNFEHDFAVLADMLSPLSIKRHTALSLHPCDYLLMSNGTGWHSCHSIPNGGWCGGTWSYMLDEVSAILYTIDAGYDNSEKKLYAQPKINRMVCCFEDNQIMFSRVYPQDTYGSQRDAIRKNFRHTVQQIYAFCRNVPNLWQKPIPCPNGYLHSAEGSLQYEDYNYSDFYAELSVLKNTEAQGMVIGTYGCCPVCGSNYSHETGTLYCEDCDGSFYCANCGETCHGEFFTLSDGDRICRDCYNDEYFTCDGCGEVFHLDYQYTDTRGWFSFCEDCASENLVECADCGGTFHVNHMNIDEDGDMYCNNCFAERVRH